MKRLFWRIAVAIIAIVVASFGFCAITPCGASSAQIKNWGVDVTSDSIQVGDTILWTIDTTQYQGAKNGAFTYDLIPAGVVYVSDSWSVPSGWSTLYSTDGGNTWLTNQPTNASSVNAVGSRSNGAVPDNSVVDFALNTTVVPLAKGRFTNKARVCTYGPDGSHCYGSKSQTFFINCTPLPAGGVLGGIVVSGVAGAVLFVSVMSSKRKRSALRH